MTLNAAVYSTLALSIFSPGCISAKGPKNMLQKPNIVYVFADQWRAQATGFAGDRNAITSALDKKYGVSHILNCCFYNACLLAPTGRLLIGHCPLAHGIFMNDAPLEPGGEYDGQDL